MGVRQSNATRAARPARRRWWTGLALAAAVCVLGLGRARAQSLDPAAVPLPITGVGPELVVGLNDLAGQLNRPAGRSLRRFADEFGAFTRTADAWAGLSRALGMSPDDAIDRLLGGRTLLLAEGIGSNELRWALVMSVDKEIGRLVTRRLRAAPRDAINGRTVYAIEDGRFRVAHVEPGDASRPAVLAIAHDGAEGLLRSALEMSAAWSEAEGGEGSAGPVIYQPEGGGAIVGELAAVENGWRLEFGPAAGNGAGPATAPGFVPGVGPSGTGAAVFEALAERSVVAYAGPVSANGAGDVGHGGGLGLLGPEDMVWLLWKFGRPSEFVRPDHDGTVFVSMEAAGGGRLDCSLWAGPQDPAQGAAAGDAYMCRLLGAFTEKYGPGKDAPECTGQAPSATRDLLIRMDPAKSSYGPALSVAWGPACGERAARCRWWGMRVETFNGLEANRTPPPLPEGGEHGADLRGVLAQIRPAGLADMLGEAEDGFGVIRALRWIDTVRWEIDPAGAGTGASGVFSVRMNPAD